MVRVRVTTAVLLLCGCQPNMVPYYVDDGYAFEGTSGPHDGSAGPGSNGLDEGAADTFNGGEGEDTGWPTNRQDVGSGDMPVCGNDIVEAPEVCDDGLNTGDYGGCMPGCMALAPRCGDGVVQANEMCDPMVDAACPATCSRSVACTTNDSCLAPNICVLGECVPKSDTGGPCDATDDCMPNNSCLSQTCEICSVSACTDTFHDCHQVCTYEMDTCEYEGLGSCDNNYTQCQTFCTNDYVFCINGCTL